MTIKKILIVDDEPLIRNFLSEALSRKNFDVTATENGKKALSFLNDHSYDLMITDMKMPGLTGLELTKTVKARYPEIVIIVATAYGSIENAVEAMKEGAFHYILKPFSPDTLYALIEKATAYLTLFRENQFLRAEQGKKNSTHQLIAESASMKKVLKEALAAAKSGASIFIEGESGTGKEVLAHTIHCNSLRANSPYIKVNCAAIPDTLIESEFFGHEKGAFTGALTKRIGRFELAHQGTLLLDEVTEIPLHLQAKLLRAIQEQEFERLGGSKPLHVDIRFIATTNRNIKETISLKQFREDLYYRLNVIPLHLPSLRERREDIIPLSLYFISQHCQENHKPCKKLTKKAEELLLEYPWPGNIRELSNILERAVVLEAGPIIDTESLMLNDSSIFR